MQSWFTELRRRFRGYFITALLAGAAALAWTIWLGVELRAEPSPCHPELERHGARCCAPGQTLRGNVCSGIPRSCPSGMERQLSPLPGCVLPPERITLPGGSVTIGPTDWDSAELVARRVVAVRSFQIDQTEVSVSRYIDCVRAGHCSPPSDLREPGQPITHVDARQAEIFCAFVGGRLPTPEEWLYAAAGGRARRYPWGAHGLVCRRAVFGLVGGPCAEHADRPEIIGSRPSGATPEGLLDLAGNVAEWTKNTEGKLSLHGGSFRSRVAGDLKTWSARPPAPADDVGFRCAYPAR